MECGHILTPPIGLDGLKLLAYLAGGDMISTHLHIRRLINLSLGNHIFYFFILFFYLTLVE